MVMYTGVDCYWLSSPQSALGTITKQGQNIQNPVWGDRLDREEDN